MPKIAKRQYDIQKMWIERIERAKKVKRDWRTLFRVQKAIDYHDGKMNEAGIPEADWISINLVYSHLQAALPSLYSVNPFFYVKPKRWFKIIDEDEMKRMAQKGRMRAAMLNYLSGAAKLKSNARLAIQDSHFAFGVLKAHYQVDMAENPDAGKVIMTEGETPVPMLNDQTGEMLVQPDKIPMNEKYRWTRVHFDDILFDEDAGPLEESWGWIAERVTMRFESALSDDRFNRNAVLTIRGQQSKDEEQEERQTRKKGSEVKGEAPSRDDKKDKQHPDKIVYWEIYDIAEKQWLFIAEGAEIPLMAPDELPEGICKHPYAILRFTLRDDSPYPIPPLSQGIDLNKEYNLARSDIQKHRKRFNRKYIASRQQFGDDMDEISKLENGDDGTIVICNGDPNAAVVPLKDAIADQARYTEMNVIRNDFVEVTGGISEEARGIAGADSATQAGILDKRLEVKEGDRLSAVIDWVRCAAEKMDQLVKVNVTTDEMILVKGPEGEMWEAVRKSDYDDIEGEYEYDVNVGATFPQLPQMERASFMAFMQILDANPFFAQEEDLVRALMEMHHLDNELAVRAIVRSAQKKIQALQAQAAQKSGSVAGVPEQNPAAAAGGQAGGPQSLMQPGAGNIQ
jgi:hypothetical protein